MAAPYPDQEEGARRGGQHPDGDICLGVDGVIDRLALGFPVTSHVGAALMAGVAAGVGPEGTAQRGRVKRGGCGFVVADGRNGEAERQLAGWAAEGIKFQMNFATAPGGW